MKVAIPVHKPDVTSKTGGLEDCPYLIVLDVVHMSWETIANPLVDTANDRSISLVLSLIEAEVRFLLTASYEPDIADSLGRVGIWELCCTEAELTEILERFCVEFCSLQKVIMDDMTADSIHPVMIMHQRGWQVH